MIQKNNDILRLYQICDLLNQQDKRIKELEEKYKDLKEDNDATTESLYACRTYLDKNTSKMWGLEKENQQLKQQLHDLHKKIVKEIRKQICEDCFWEECEEQHCEFYFIIEYLNAILKKYGDGE